jgi:hypothetical protein
LHFSGAVTEKLRRRHTPRLHGHPAGQYKNSMRAIGKTRPLCDEYVGTVRAEKLPWSGCARLFLVAMATVLSSGCAAVALTAGGVAAAVGVNHTMNGIVYKTFSEPLPKVKRATLTALKQMEIPVETVEKTKQANSSGEGRQPRDRGRVRGAHPEDHPDARSRRLRRAYEGLGDRDRDHSANRAGAARDVTRGGIP